jgi:ankyrin repeat protein
MKKTPEICWAAYTKDLNEVKSLLTNGADIESRDRDKRTPLLNAVSGSDVSKKLIQFLIDNGADVNAKDANGYSSLHFCAQANMIEIAELLIANGAIVSRHDETDFGLFTIVTSTCYALMAENKPNPGAFIKWLLSKGANPLAKSKSGDTSLEYAGMLDRDVLQFFRET